MLTADTIALIGIFVAFGLTIGLWILNRIHTSLDDKVSKATFQMFLENNHRAMMAIVKNCDVNTKTTIKIFDRLDEMQKEILQK